MGGGEEVLVSKPLEDPGLGSHCPPLSLDFDRDVSIETLDSEFHKLELQKNDKDRNGELQKLGLQKNQSENDVRELPKLGLQENDKAPDDELQKLRLQELPKLGLQGNDKAPDDELQKLGLQELPKLGLQGNDKAPDDELQKLGLQELPKLGLQGNDKAPDDELQKLGLQGNDRAPDDELQKLGLQEQPKSGLQESDKAPDDELQKLGLQENEKAPDDELQKLGLQENEKAPDDELQKLGLQENEKAPDDELQKLGLQENENQNESESVTPKGDTVTKEEKNSGFQYPLRPDELDCVYYLRTGICGYGSNCRFNHPPRNKNKTQSSSDSPKSVEVANERENENEEYPERTWVPECKYYLTVGGCKFGKDCKYHHSRVKTLVEPPLDLNFLGLPIRPGEKECPFYMRNGSCKFANNCKFHHPDPTAVGGSEPLSGYHTEGSFPVHSPVAPQTTFTSWPSPRTQNETISYLDASPSYMPVMFSPPQRVHANLESNGSLAPLNPLYPLERNIQPPLISMMSDPAKKVNGSTLHQREILVEEFPERPGQRECQYFMKNGNCNFKSSCKFHHPKDRISKCVLNPMGLPLRPDQSVCSYYSRYGICKFGPACRYDHSPNHASSASVSLSGQLPSFDNS